MKPTYLKSASLLLSTVALIFSSSQLSTRAEQPASATARASNASRTIAAVPASVNNSSSYNLSETPVPGTVMTSASTLRADSAKAQATVKASPNTLLAQDTTAPPTEPSTAPTNPGSSTTTTPSNPANPVNPGTVDPGTTTTPDTTAPTQTTPDTTTPGTTTTPDTTTPDTTAPTQTTPDTTTPGTTTTPDTTAPESSLIAPGRATRSGPSYFGIGGNIGIGSGGTALGDGSFAIISKIGLTRNFSARPSLLISDDVTILLPVTLDFPLGAGPAALTEPLGFSVAPYVGIGPAISTGDGASVDLLLTGGVDVPVGSQFTFNAAVNATVTGKPAVGILLGIGYNFAGF